MVLELFVKKRGLQDSREPFYGGGGGRGVLRKNVSRYGWPTAKNEEKNIGSSSLKQSPKNQKTKFGPKYKRFKISSLNSFFENFISDIQLFYIYSDEPLDIIRVFFNFRSCSRKSQSQKR